MASIVTKTDCTTCRKAKHTYECNGCQQPFCLEHLVEHQNVLAQQLDDVENQRNLFKQTLSQYQTDSLQQINQWEQKSIQLIQQTAEDTRQIFNQYTNEHLTNITIRLDKLTDRIKDLRKENDFNEIDLNNLKIQLERLQKQLDEPKHIEIREDFPLINKIEIVFPSCLTKYTNIPKNMKWYQNAMTIAGGNGEGQNLDQLYLPQGIDIDHDGSIIVADRYNHRIVEWKKDDMTGQIIAGGNGNGNRNDQLDCPVDVIIDHHNDALIIADRYNRRVVRWPRRNGQNGETIISNIYCWALAMDTNGYLYIIDDDKYEVRRWKIGDKEEILVAGGNGRGSNLNQFKQPTGIFIDDNDSIYISDKENHRVMKWTKDAKEGIVVAGGNKGGNSLSQLFCPEGIFVDRFETIYVADNENHRVVRWLKGSNQGEIIVGGNGRGQQSNNFNGLMDLLFDKEHNLYIVDLWNNRIQKFLAIQNK